MQRNSDKILTEWLVLNIQNGSIAALEQLLKIWQPKFLRYSTSQLNNKESANDVTQEALLTISKRIKQLKDPVAFPKWAYQILHRRGVDYIRKEMQIRRSENSKLDESLIHDSPRNTASPLDTKIDIYKAISNLDEMTYRLVHLHYLEGLTIKEVATVVAIPEGTVKSRLHSARSQLRQHWKKDND